MTSKKHFRRRPQRESDGLVSASMFAKRGNPWVSEKDREKDRIDPYSRHELQRQAALADYKSAQATLRDPSITHEERLRAIRLKGSASRRVVELVSKGDAAFRTKEDGDPDLDYLLKAEYQKKGNPLVSKGKPHGSPERSSRDPGQTKLLNARIALRKSINKGKS